MGGKERGFQKYWQVRKSIGAKNFVTSSSFKSADEPSAEARGKKEEEKEEEDEEEEVCVCGIGETNAWKTRIMERKMGVRR